MERLTKEYEEDITPISVICRRERFEKYIKQRPYCTKPEDNCIYKADEIDDNGYYRCMLLEKVFH